MGLFAGISSASRRTSRAQKVALRAEAVRCFRFLMTSRTDTNGDWITKSEWAGSTLAALPDRVAEPAMRRLEADLVSETRVRRHEDLLHRDAADYGFRLLVSD